MSKNPFTEYIILHEKLHLVRVLQVQECFNREREVYFLDTFLNLLIKSVDLEIEMGKFQHVPEKIHQSLLAYLGILKCRLQRLHNFGFKVQLRDKACWFEKIHCDINQLIEKTEPIKSESILLTPALTIGNDPLLLIEYITELENQVLEIKNVKYGDLLDWKKSLSRHKPRFSKINKAA